MKNVSLILNKMKKNCSDIEGMENINTLQEGIELLAKASIVGGAKAVNTFKKYALYDSEYVKKNLPLFYDLIQEQVKQQEEKELIKAKKKQGFTQAESEAELEKLKTLNSLGKNRIFGYARVSTKEQNLGRQLKALEEAGCQYIFQEKKSGKDTDRIEFKSMMHHLEAGDIIIISELTRLARSTADLFNIMAEIDEKGASIKSLKEAWLDTTTATGRLMFTIMSGMAQFERELMLERQSEGIKVAKENGVKFGKKLDTKADLDLAIALYKEGRYTTTQIAEMTHISRTTLWRKLKQLGLQ